MSNKKRPPLALRDTEWDLLGVLWDRKRATARDIAAALQDKRGWAYSTVKTLLDRMVDKGLVTSRRIGNVYEYRAAVQPEEARRGAWRRFLGDAFGGALDPALRFIVEETELTDRQKAKLRNLVEELDEK